MTLINGDLAFSYYLHASCKRRKGSYLMLTMRYVMNVSPSMYELMLLINVDYEECIMFLQETRS